MAIKDAACKICPCARLWSAWQGVLPSPHPGGGPPGQAGQSLPALSWNGGAAAIVSSLPAMAANFTIPARRPDNVRREVDARQWVNAAMSVLEEAWKVANDDNKWVSQDQQLLSTQACQCYHAQDSGYSVGREPIGQLDMRTKLLEHIPAAQQDTARERLHARGTRDQPAPLVCNHFVKADIGTNEGTTISARTSPPRWSTSARCPRDSPTLVD